MRISTVREFRDKATGLLCSRTPDPRHASRSSGRDFLSTAEITLPTTWSMSLFVPDLPFPVRYSFVIVNKARQVNAAIMNPGVGTAELVRK